jgi:hypothetical protein
MTPMSLYLILALSRTSTSKGEFESPVKKLASVFKTKNKMAKTQYKVLITLRAPVCVSYSIQTV